MKKWLSLVLSVLVFAVLAKTAERWLPPFLQFIKLNSDLIQGLTDLVQLVLWVATALVAAFGFWRTQQPPQQGTDTRSTRPSVGDRGVSIGGGATGSNIITGDRNRVQPPDPEISTDETQGNDYGN